MSVIGAVAAGPDGSVHINGFTSGDLSVTPGVYQTQFMPVYVCSPSDVAPCIQPPDGFLTRIDPTGPSLLYPKYVSYQFLPSSALTFDPPGNAYFANSGTRGPMNSTESALIQSIQLQGTVGVLALDGKANLYATGSALAGLVPTPGAFQTTPQPSASPFARILRPGYFHE